MLPLITPPRSTGPSPHSYASNLLQGQKVDSGHAARAKESIAANARWLEQHGQQACAWIKSQAAAAPLTVDEGRTG